MSFQSNLGQTPFKVPLIGDANVGKTSIVSRLTTDIYTGNTTPTVGVSNVQITLKHKDKDVALGIWDTAGQEKFRSLIQLYTRNSSLLILVFDISSVDSFHSIDFWYKKIRVELDNKSPMFLCANKIDLSPVISREAIEEWARLHECRTFYTSAQNGEGIDEMFHAVAATLSDQEEKPLFGNTPNLNIANKERACC